MYLIDIPFTEDDLAARLLAYQRYRSRIQRGHLHQRQIDAAAAALVPGKPAGTTSRHSSVTQGLVRDLVRDSSCAVTATEVATGLGIGRATAQRYLSVMADSGELAIALRYGSTGRPEHEYRWNL